jgi:outer membrane lipoprotein SlyB
MMIISGTSTISIDQRWFIIEWQKIRGKQYRAILKRDVIADNYENVTTAPTYIEKATIRNKNNPLLYNKEGMAYNQIKISETPIKDETQVGWVVGYIPSDSFKTSTTISSNVQLTTASADITVNGLSSWNWWKNTTQNSAFKYLTSNQAANKVGLKVRWRHTEIGYSDSYVDFYGQTLWFNTSSGYLSADTNHNTGQDASDLNWPAWADNYHITGPTTAGQYYKTELTASERNALINQFTNNTFTGYVNNCLNSSQTEVGSASEVLQIQALNGKIIKDSSTNQYYQINITNVSSDNPLTPDYNTSSGQILIDYVRTGVNNASGWSANGTITTGDVLVALTSPAYAVNLTQITINCEVTLDSDRYHLSDAPYDMFCIPYSNDLWLNDGTNTFRCYKEVAINIAVQIGKAITGNQTFDIQLLPYCPARHLVVASPYPYSTLQLTSGKYNEIVVKQNGSITQRLGAVIWCMTSSFSFTRNTPTQYVPNRVPNNTALNYKLSNELDMFRLTSGNFNGMFEYSVAKSDGVSQFKIECTYKPFNPYIHVTPVLKGLYGSNYGSLDDMRGLICGGSFSLGQLTSAWSAYELNNVNYQAVFDRTIQNLDVQYDIAKQQALTSAITGTITGTSSGSISGAMVGSKVGGGYGAVAGAVIGGVAGGVASGVAGGMDYRNVKALQEENRDFQTDLYNYNLQNIKAIPESLSKGSAFTINTRIWPMIEYFKATDEETQALKDKLTYNGMTVMKIDIINNYLASNTKTFIQGRVIRLANVGESAIASEIYNEIKKGVYI